MYQDMGPSKVVEEISKLKYSTVPLKEHMRYLTQRNNNTYTSLLQPSELTAGKGGFGFNPAKGWLIVISENGNNLNMNDLRDYFLNFGCTNALFLDGSDSVLLFIKGEFKVRSGSGWKDDTQTSGLAFKVE